MAPEGVTEAAGRAKGAVLPDAFSERVFEKKSLKKRRENLQVSKLVLNFASFFAPPLKRELRK